MHTLQQRTSRVLGTGLHILGDLHGCRRAWAGPDDAELLEARCRALIAQHGLTVVGTSFHAFPGAGGVTGALVLAESHVALHTWPERDYVSLDVFVCNLEQDHGEQARAVFDALVALFEPSTIRRQDVARA